METYMLNVCSINWSYLNILFYIWISYAKILGGNYFAHGSFPEMGQNKKTEKIIQGLREAQAAVTERWP